MPGRTDGRHTATEIEAVVFARLTEQHRVELASVRALLVRYREALEDAGVPVPDMTGAEALARYRFAFQAADLADTEQHPELHAEPWR